ncbi:Protein FAM200A [Dictyocoela muelleri]|nr:Protein FAM200A [Dictyocoela muelleri]
MQQNTLGEKLIKQSCLAIVKTFFGDKHTDEIKKIPLSNNTMGIRIQDMSDNIKLQMKKIFEKEEIVFVLQLDESTDVSGSSKLLVYIRFIFEENIIEKFLFCQNLALRTSIEDICDVLFCFIDDYNLK